MTFSEHFDKMVMDTHKISPVSRNKNPWKTRNEKSVNSGDGIFQETTPDTMYQKP